VACSSCKESLSVLDAPAVFLVAGFGGLDRCISCFAFDGVVKDAIHRFKYSGELSLRDYFASQLFKRLPDLPDFDVVVTVPMHKNKIVKRGFNQAALIAASVARRAGKKFCHGALVRISDGASQTQLQRTERIASVKGAFNIDDSAQENIKNKKVLIIDDVTTTGATICECAKVLKKAGAEKIYALTLARTIA
jgi:ComF family protein